MPAAKTQEPVEQIQVNQADLIEQFGSDCSYYVHVHTWDKKQVGIRFEHISEDHGHLTATLKVLDYSQLRRDGSPTLLTSCQYNMASQVTRDGVAKSLARKTPDIEMVYWEAFLLYASEYSDSFWRSGSNPLRDAGTYEPEWVPPAIGRMIPRGESTILYGDAASVKSFILLAMLVGIALNRRVGPFVPKVSGPVMYLDWETSENEIFSRLDRICRGLGLGKMPKDLFKYRAMTRPLVGEMETIDAEIKRFGVVAVGIDSIAWAVGAEVDSKSVIPFFNGLRTLGSGVTRIIVSHITKADARGNGPASPYGSTFVRAAARSAWEIDRNLDSTDEDISVAMRHTKVNQGKKHQPVHISVKFDDTEEEETGQVIGPITFGTADVKANPGLMDKAPLKDKIKYWVGQSYRETGIPPTTGELAKLVKDQEAVVGLVANRLRSIHHLTVVPTMRNGKPVEGWGVVDNRFDEPPPQQPLFPDEEEQIEF